MGTGVPELNPLVKFLIGFWGAFPGFPVLVGFIVIDIGFGLWVAWVTKTVSSKTSWVGMTRKVAMILITMMCFVLESAIQLPFLEGKTPMSHFVCFMWCISELISVIENAAILGLPIPQQVAEVLVTAKRNLKPVDIRTVEQTPEPEPIPVPADEEGTP